MWGHLYTESNYQLNFNFGFPTHKSDILIHLSQWQYWWWFWFAVFWTFYYFIITTTVKNRTTKMNPRINTSLRGRGKWGDFLVALVPLSWCANILLNSNFILRLIEWQNESSLLTVRIHGKQWYWIYKFDLSNSTSMLTVPKNIGKNRWVLRLPTDSIISESYMKSIHVRAQKHWLQTYWNGLLNDKFNSFENSRLATLNKYKILKTIDGVQQILDLYKVEHNSELNLNFVTPTNSNFLENTVFEDFFKFDTQFFYIWRSNKFSLHYITCYVPYMNPAFENEKHFVYGGLKNYKFEKNFNYFRHYRKEREDMNFFNIHKNFKFNLFKFKKKLKNIFLFSDDLKFKKFINSHFNYDKLDDLWDVQKTATRKHFKVMPLRLVKQVVSYDYYNTLNNILKFNFYDNNNSLIEKLPLGELFWVLKQKKYKKKNKFFNFNENDINTSILQNEFQYFFDNNENIKNALELNNLYSNNKDYSEFYNLCYKSSPESLYKCIRNSRQRSEYLPVTMCKRLLRTKKTLVLPTHVNISLVTNSYDVVHSWYIPALGIKLDCVPGRSTHHTLYLDYIGLYYGQCAEICGRYHHHMPIRIAGLPFEHFVVWWQLKGHHKILDNRIKKEKIYLLTTIKKKYAW